MRQALFLPIVLVVLTSSLSAYAQDSDMMDRPKHMAPDARQPVNFPPEMRQRTLNNMRDYVQTLADIQLALSRGDYAKAGLVADTRLGMDSQAAEGCKLSDDAGQSSRMPQSKDMEHMMALYKPEGMPKLGLAMHQSASEFAEEASKAGKTGDSRPALEALVRVTQHCVACHSAYRLQ